MRCPTQFAGYAMLSVLLAQSGGVAQQAAPAAGADWPMYRHDFAGTGYSPLAQIDAKNVAKLAQAWTFSLQSDAPPAPTAARGRGGPAGNAGPNSEVTPIVVNGVMYLPTANRIVALEPETGKQIWQYQVTAGAPSRRGVAYWPGDGSRPARILFTTGRRLAALNATSGAVDQGFGQRGEVDLVLPYNSVPLVYKNIIIVEGNTPPQPLISTGNAEADDR